MKKSRARFIFHTIGLFGLLFLLNVHPSTAEPRLITPSPVEPAWKPRPVRLPPLFWYERDPDVPRRVLMVSLLYWDVLDQQTTQKLLLPIFYRWREEDRSLLVSLPFVVSYLRPGERWFSAGPFFRSSNDERTYSFFFPLYGQKIREGGGRVTTAFPFLFYDYRSSDRSRIDQVTPFGWMRRRPDRSSGMLLNYWWFKIPEENFRTLFPVYWSVRKPASRFEALVPFYYRKEELRPGPWATAASTVSTPSLTSEASSAFGSSGVVPSPKSYPTRRWAGLFPVLGGGWGGGLSSHYLFPLYFYSRADLRRSFITLPASAIRDDDQRQGHIGLYYYSHDPDLRVDGVFPFWFHRRSADGFENKTHFLNFYARRENEDSFRTLFPLYGYWSSPEQAQLLSWGVWWKRAPDFHSGWAYLYHWKRAGEDTTRIFFPLYWHFWRTPDWGFDTFFPFYTRYRDGPTVITAVPPVFIRRSEDQTTWSFLFLFWRDRQKDQGSLSVFPFFHYNFNTRRRMLFAPLFWTRTSPSSREGIVPPVYWYRSAEARRTVVFPLLWRERSEDKSITIVPPYYQWRNKDRNAYGVFPVWGRQKSEKERGGYLLPFYWYSGDGRGNGMWVIPPALAYITRHGYGTGNPRLNVQYLLLGNIQKSSHTLQHDFFPLYRYVRSGSDDYTNFWAPRIVALVAWEREGVKRKGVVVPYLWRRAPQKDWDLFIPLWYRSRTYEVSGSTDGPRVRAELSGGALSVFPLYWQGRNEERDYRFVVPLYAHYAEGDRRFTMFMPLWTSYTGETGRKFRLFFPLYWRFLLKSAPEVDAGLDAPAEKDIVVFGPWYRIDSRGKGRSSRTVGFAPFYSNTASGDQDRYFEIFGGLFGRDIQDGQRRFRYLYFFYTKSKTINR